MSDRPDPLERADEIDRKFLAVPQDKVFTKRNAVAFVLAVVLVLSGGYWVNARKLDRVVTETNDAVTVEIPGLKRQNADLHHTIDQQQDVLGQATTAIVDLCHRLEAAGEKCPEIVLRPKDDK